MEWMYKNDQKNADSEEYLLGKAIDKDFYEKHRDVEISEKIKEKAFEQLKYKDDPLSLIEAKKWEYKKEILKNPIKLKKLKKAMESHANINNSITNTDSVINDFDMKILKKWKRLRKSCFYFQNIALKEFANPLVKNTNSTPAESREIENNPLNSGSEDSDDSFVQYKREKQAQKMALNKGHSNRNYNRQKLYKEPSPIPQTTYRANKEREKRRKEVLDREDMLNQMRLNAEWNQQQRHKIVEHHKKSRYEENAREGRDHQSPHDRHHYDSSDSNSSDRDVNVRKKRQKSPILKRSQRSPKHHSSKHRDRQAIKSVGHSQNIRASPTFIKPMLSEMTRMNTLESRIRNNRTKSQKFTGDD